jgi:hypothetical protein
MDTASCACAKSQKDQTSKEVQERPALARVVNCLVCELNPIQRCDFDGLCISCRSSVAQGLYRIDWVEKEPDSYNTTHKLVLDYHPVNGFKYNSVVPKRYRVVTIAHCTEDVFGCEWPNFPDPIPYLPELLPRFWSTLDELNRSIDRIEIELHRIEMEG